MLPQTLLMLLASALAGLAPAARAMPVGPGGMLASFQIVAPDAGGAFDVEGVDCGGCVPCPDPVAACDGVAD